MKKLLLVTLILFTFQFAHSQQTFSKEFVVTIKGDTIYGTVIIERRNFKQVKFADSGGQIHSYGTTEITSFYDNEWGLYVASIISLDITKGEVLQSADAVNVFLETVIVSGDLTIYFFKNSEYGSRYFIKKGNGSLNELILREKPSQVNGQRVIIRDEQYKKTLVAFLNDCSNIRDEINKTNLSQHGLQGLLIKYSTCHAKNPEYKSTPDKGQWTWGISAAWFTSSFKYSNVNTSPDQAYSSSSGPTFGMSANYLISVRNKKTSILNELLYRKLASSSTYSSPYYYEVNDTKYQLDYLRLNTLLRYNFVKPMPVHPFLLIGISNSFIISSNSNLTLTTSLGTTQRKLETKGYEQGILLGGGFNFKKVDVFGRFELSNGFIPSNSIDKMSVLSTYIGLTYLLN